jgi:flap endonuclease-1
LVLKKIKRYKKAMGIKGLSEFLRKKCPLAFVPTELGQYRGLRVAIDVPIYAYKYAFYKTAPSDVDTVLNGFLRQNRTWTQRYGMTCIFVFDGPSVAAKMAEHQRREKARASLKQKQQVDLQELKEEAAEHMQKGNDFELMSAYLQMEAVQRRSTSVSSTEYECLKELFQEKNIPFCVGEGDAEKKCAELCLSGEADVVATEDYDALVCGAPRVLRNVSKLPEEVHLQTVLDNLQFTQEQFIHFCVLCGSDFTTYLPNVGPAAAYKAIQTYGTIDQFFEKDVKGQKLAKNHPEFDYVTALALFHH